MLRQTRWTTMGLVIVLGVLLLFYSNNKPAQSGETTTLTAEERQWLEARNGQIRLAPMPDWPPLDSLGPDGRPQGLMADYIELLEQRLQCRFQIVPTRTFQERLELAQAGKVDILTTLVATPERERYLTFIGEYAAVPAVIIIQQGRSDFSGLGKAGGQRVALVRGYSIQEYLRQRFPLLEPVLVDNDREALRLVAMGQVDAAISDMAAASLYIQQEGIANLKVAGETGYVYHCQLAVRKDQTILAGILRKGMNTISTAEREALYRKWVGLASEQPRREPAWAALLGGAVCGGLAVWWWRRPAAKEPLADAATTSTIAAATWQERFHWQHQLLAAVPGLVYRCRNNRDWPLLYASDGALALTGYTAEQLMQGVPVRFAELIYPDDEAWAWQEIQTALAERRAYWLVFRIRTRQNEKKWVLESGRGIYAANGQLLYLQGLILDLAAAPPAWRQTGLRS